MIRKRCGAYFTVESALILPFITCVLVVLLYLLFFQYNRCLLEQDMGSLALKGCSMSGVNKEETGNILRQKAQEIYYDKYIAWEIYDMNVELNGSMVITRCKAALCFPFESPMDDIGRNWKTEVEYKNERSDATYIIRLYRKLGGE